MATRRPEASLEGRTVLVTRAAEDATSLSEPLRQLGARVLTLPTIAIVPPEDSEPLDIALRQLARYDWAVFVSRHAVEAVFARLNALGLRFPAGPRVAAVGPATASSLAELGVRVDRQPASPSAAALAATLHDDVDRQWILLPVSQLSRPELKQGLEVVGGFVNEVVAYRTVPPATADPEVLAALHAGQVEAVALASPSAANHLVALLGGVEPLRQSKLVCIGPTTAREVRALGLEPAAIAPTPTMAGLVQAIAYLFTE